MNLHLRDLGINTCFKFSTDDIVDLQNKRCHSCQLNIYIKIQREAIKCYICEYIYFINIFLPVEIINTIDI